MSDDHILKGLLQFQLASDAQAVLNAPYVLGCISSSALRPSPHLSKWLTRINTLVRAQDPGVVWAGLAFALQTAVSSKSIMIESANGWLTVALPILARKDGSPTLKAAIRLIRTILSKATDVTEFQRQVCASVVPKFSEALLSVIHNTSDVILKIFCLDTLTLLISLYPSLHRQSQNATSALTQKFLDGSAPSPVNDALLHAASRTYTTLPVTGGKVAAANLWRKSMEDTLRKAMSAFAALRLTFNSESYPASDPIIEVPLSLDRLRCSITVLQDLFKVTVRRPVQLPLGALMNFAYALLSCTSEAKDSVRVFDKTRRDMEISVLPSIRALGCQFVITLCTEFRTHTTPYTSRLLAYLLFHLESKPSPVETATLMDTARSLLSTPHPISSELLLSRLVRVVLPSIAAILPSQSYQAQLNDNEPPANGVSKKGKKRARGYEGDEILKVGSDFVCPTADERSAVIAALEVAPLLLSNPALPPTLHSLATRVLLSLLLSLPQVAASILSPDPSFHSRVSSLVTEACRQISQGTSSVLGRTLTLLVGQLGKLDIDSQQMQHGLDILIHPRLPPLVRSMPHVENLALFKAEESLEEAELRTEILAIETHSKEEDVVMQEPKAPAAPVVPAFQSQIPPKQTVVIDDLIAPKASSLPVPSPAEPMVSSTQPPVETPIVAADMFEVVEEEEEGGEEEMPGIDVDSDSD